MRSLLGRLASLVLFSLVASGCGNDAGSAIGVSSSGGSSANGPSGPGASVPSGGNLMLGPGVTTDVSSGTVVTPEAACATGTASASLAGVNIIVMFDRSTSMNQSANQGGATRWALTSAALTAFFQSSEAAGLKLALRFFPHDLPVQGCNGDPPADGGCNAAACGTPLVNVGTLTADAAPMDQQEAALVNATMMSAPVMESQGTPIYAALDGALQWARAQRQTTPNENSVVVLVTDGQANGCEVGTEAIAGLAADALASDNIRTYAIGLTGSSDAEINAIAMAGGTMQGLFVADGANTQQELLQALTAIRGQALDCDIPLPQPKAGQSLDPTKVNVNVTNNGTQGTLPQVGDAASCAAMPGWYYDNGLSPTRIILCPASCDAVTVDVSATLDILLGCETVTDVPK